MDWCAPQKVHPFVYLAAKGKKSKFWSLAKSVSKGNILTVTFPVFIAKLMADLGQFAVLVLKSRTSIAAENPFLRKQLALFVVSVTATFRLLYVFVAMEVGSRCVLHCNVTSHPTAEWTLQQFREVFAFDHPYRFIVHDRDSIFSAEVDAAVKHMGVKVLRTPFRAPMANAYCERLVATFRRECLDWVIPFGELHLRQILREEVTHYNRGRPHSALGPGIPEPIQAKVPASVHRHKLPEGYGVGAKGILGGLHHEYNLGKQVT